MNEGRTDIKIFNRPASPPKKAGQKDGGNFQCILKKRFPMLSFINKSQKKRSTQNVLSCKQTSQTVTFRLPDLSEYCV